ncbi:Cysteine-rich receptor-like protein kinase [Thalictrum thalictroides]|uniref:Cysteine-rich receptor-like protein kinase n=1 Tax=Thalictrum thalictroides TaxID=46969 RepID=A0A7J6VV63_THATH|nr:Cysteine-rich receptor-like protein kinase [Thalictrum thalictroides]
MVFLFPTLSFIFILLILHFNPITSQTSPLYCIPICSGGTYTSNSVFDSNLQLLLSSLSSNLTSNDDKRFFFNATAGSNSDKVYGLYQCRGDVTSDICKNCVETAITAFKTKKWCPIWKKAILWYDECMLRYSNDSFISVRQEDPTIYMSNPNAIGDANRFNPMMSKLMDGLVTQAVNSSNLFATGNANYSLLENVYGLAQCTQDITGTDCNICLRKALTEIPKCCANKRGGRVLKPSCYIRYETYIFYQSKPIAPVPPTPRIPFPTLTNDTRSKGQKSSSRTTVIIVLLIVIGVVLLLSSIAICLCLRRKNEFKIVKDVNEISSVESLQFNIGTVRAATENFCDANKLGEGGFGAVYKGILSDGREIAVKRLSRNSGLGVEEFKKEVLLVAKLQHQNLVRLLGFCLEGDETLLIYEFLPNTSLDRFIFDPIKRTHLNWERRYNIIGGIARGLLYLHEDSRHRIIHQDLKASNVLLDAEMNPKISDFVMARLFKVDQTQGNTSTRAGMQCSGYMAPEYAMHGQFSVKSDVFSFGVLVLETITGRKNSLYESESDQNLLSYVWRHWDEGTALELIEPSLEDCYSRTEVTRCIHIGLLCVQEDMEMRPTMASVVLMLNSYSVTMPLPSTPAHFVSTIKESYNTTGDDEAYTNSSSHTVSINEVSITELYPR